MSTPATNSGDIAAVLTSMCEECRTILPLLALDAKPTRLAGKRNHGNLLQLALDRNEDCDRLECRRCFGPGFVRGAA